MKINPRKLKCYRKRTGLTSQEFAFVCDIPVGTYFSYESGQRSPKYENLKVIAEKLKVTIDELTSEDDEYFSDVKKTKEEIAKERMQIDYYLLKNRRKRLGVKAEYMARCVGVSVSRYREYERGLGNPTRAMVRNMCNALNIKFYELVVE